jgi:hypothetical protein
MKKFTLCALAAAITITTSPSQASAQAVIGKQLAQVLPTISGGETIIIVVTFEQMNAVSVSQIHTMKALGISKGVQFSAVPVMGLVVNITQIEAIVARDDVRSVWLNRKLDCFNASSRQITGVDKIQGVEFANRNGGNEYTSRDVTIPDGTDWTYNNEVTIVAPGRYVISTRSSNNMVANGNLADSVIEPTYLPFYTRILGTSIATPHAAGVVALVMEANPLLKIDKVKQLVKKSAANMLSYEAWEVGAYYINARAAVAAKGFDNKQRDTINNCSDAEFFVNIDMQAHKFSEGKLALIVLSHK